MTLFAHHIGGDASALVRGQAVHDLMRAHEVVLLQQVLDAVKSRNSVRLIGPAEAEDRAPTVAVAFDRAAEPISEALGREGIACWAGDFYAVRPLEAMGVDLGRGVLRMSLAHYTSAEDVARLIAALDRVL